MSEQGDDLQGRVVVIGGYVIRNLDDGKVWIQSPEGEGMEIARKVFIGALDQLFAEQF